jgi:hypothetical protein
VVAVAPGAGTPTGTVAFKRLFSDGTTVTFGTAPLDASGTAVFAMDHFVPATATLFAVYQGDSNFMTSTSATLTHVIHAASTTLTLASNTPVSVVGQPVTFTSTLSVVPPGSFVVAPTGTLTLLDTFAGTTTTLVTATLGGPPVSFPALTAVGTHVITAVYSGDSNFNGSTSPPIDQIVNPSASPPPSGGGPKIPESKVASLEALAMFAANRSQTAHAGEVSFAGLVRPSCRDATDLVFADFEQAGGGGSVHAGPEWGYQASGRGGDAPSPKV